MVKKKLIIGITSPKSTSLLVGQLKYFTNLGYETYLMCPNDLRVEEYFRNEDCNCKHIPIAIEREIHLVRDIKSLWAIYKAMRKIKPDIVNVGTPKMGFLGILAAKLLKVRGRIYTCRGLRYEREKGLKRKILIFMEWFSGFCAHKIICISPSVKETGIKDNVFNPQKCVVINKGSSNGLDLKRFSRETIEEHSIEQLKRELCLERKFVFGYAGRLSDEKGINELFEVFEQIYSTNSDVRLLCVGTFDMNQIADKRLIKRMEQHSGVLLVGRQIKSIIPLYLSIIDVFVSSTWGEGFGNTLIEVAAMGVPVISTSVTGVKDAVSNGYNGTLIPVKDKESLKQVMIEFMFDDAKRKRFGTNGIEWAKNFSNEIIWEGMAEIYSDYIYNIE